MLRPSRHVEAFWAVKRGKRFVVATSAEEIQALLETCWAYERDPNGWLIERTVEEVPVVRGERFVAQGEIIEAGSGRMLADDIAAPHVRWVFPHCDRPHTTDLCSDLECMGRQLASSQLWACEYGGGEWKLVWIEW